MKTLESLIRDIKWSFIASAILSILMGAVLILWPDMSGEVLGYIIGFLFIVYGIFSVISYVTHPILMDFGLYLFTGLLSVIFGILIVTNPGIVKSTASVALGLFVMIDGIINMRRSVLLSSFGYSRWWLSLTVSVLCVVLGILVLLFPSLFGNILLMALGIAIVLGGIADIVTICKVSKFRKSLENRTVDVDFTEL